MNEIINLQSLPEEVSRKFIPFLKDMLTRHEGNVVSVFIYGSAAGKNYVPRVSDINSVFVFRTLAFDVFQKSLKTVSRAINKKIAAPLFLTKDYILSSLDVFPIEFLDMKENHILLYGEDILSPLEIKGEHIRLFCEQQLKGKLIRIRQAYLEVGLHRKGLESLLKESLNSLLPVFRNLIRLKGKTPAVKKTEIIRELCREFSLDEGVFLPIYNDTTNDEKIANQDVAVFLDKYIEQIRRLSERVDQL